MVGKGSSRSERTALKALPTNTKRLVGRGSPRIPTVGKGQVCVHTQTRYRNISLLASLADQSQYDYQDGTGQPV